MIKLENVSKYYNTEGNVSLGLRNINVELHANEIVAITGESGSGKTTFLNVISGVDSYEAGEMYFNGEPTSYFSAEDMETYRKNNVGFIFQSYNLVESYTVLQNVMTMLILKGYSDKEAKKRALELIERVGLTKRRHNKATKLSGGEKQRCVIARALASDSLILACDEPTGNLDSKTGKEIIELIKSVSEGRLVLIVTHNYDEVKDIATRKLRFYDGELVEDKVLKETAEASVYIAPNDYQIKRTDDLKIAWRNIIATPKKTIFTFFVLLTFCFFVGSLYEMVISSDFLTNSSGGYYQSNVYQIKNRVLFSGDIDSQKIEELFPDNYVVYNDYFSDQSYMGTCDEITHNTFIDYTGRNDYKLLCGKYPEKANEIVISSVHRSRFYNIKKSSELLGKSVHFSFGDYEIVGISDDSNEYQYCDYLTPDNVNVLRMHLITNYSNKGISVSVDGNSASYHDVDTKNDNMINVKSYITEEEFKRLEFNIYIGDTAVDLSSYDITYTHLTEMNEGNNTLFEVEIDQDAIKNMLETTYDFGSLFTSSVAESEKAVKKLTGLGLVAYDAGNIGLSYGLNYYFDFFGFVIQVVVSVFGLLVIYFITYLVLSFVVSSKKKDYTILRTLGISKKNLNHVVDYENIAVMLAAFVFFILINILVPVIWNIKIIGFIIEGRILETFLLLIILILLSLLLSRRFNKKMFRVSVNSSLKKEAL